MNYNVMRKYFAIFIWLILGIINFQPLYCSELTVHMQILESKSSVFIKSLGNMSFYDENSRYNLGRNKELEIVYIPGSRDMLIFKDKKLYLSSSEFTLKSTDDFSIRGVKNRFFSKKGILFYTTKDKIEVVLKIDMKNYLQGVLSAEMGENTPIEALKAQAIASRTYVMFKMDKKGIAYKNHVPSTNNGQVYEYADNFGKNIKDAVEETRGEILTYKNKPALTLYSSCCGGVTENSDVPFKGTKLPYLISKRDHSFLKKIIKNTKKALSIYKTSFCQFSDNYRWTRDYSAEKIGKMLKVDEKIDGFEVTSVDDSGRVQKVVVTFGNRINSYSGTLIRKKLKLPSTFFYIEHDENSFIYTIKGGGFGHGVSMWGNWHGKRTF